MENSIQNQEAYLVAKERVKKIKGFYVHLTVYIAVNAFIIGGIFVDRPFSFDNFFRFSTFATAFFWGIGLVAHWSGVFGRRLFFSKDWEDRKIQEYIDKQK